MASLTAKRQRFVNEYLIDLNATQAAIRAGYSEKTAHSQGPRLLDNVEVQAAIAKAQQERSQRTQIDADWVLARLAEEADADLADLYDENGNLLPVKEWPDIWRKGLVAGVDVTHEYETVDGKKESVGFVSKIKLSDRIRRLELIGKHVDVKAFAERHEHTGKDGGPIETADVSDLEAARRLAYLLAKGADDAST